MISALISPCLVPRSAVQRQSTCLPPPTSVSQALGSLQQELLDNSIGYFKAKPNLRQRRSKLSVSDSLLNVPSFVVKWLFSLRCRFSAPKLLPSICHMLPGQRGSRGRCSDGPTGGNGHARKIWFHFEKLLLTDWKNYWNILQCSLFRGNGA